MEEKNGTGRTVDTEALKAKLDFLLTRSPVVCFEVSLDGTILFVTPAISRISSFSSAELVQRSMWNLYAEMDDREELLAALSSQGELRDYRVTFRDKGGEQRRYSIDAIIIGGRGGFSGTLFGTLTALDQFRGA